MMILKKILAEYKKLGEYKLILTTEKDYVRLKTFDYLREIVYYWPINVLIDKERRIQSNHLRLCLKKIKETADFIKILFSKP